MTTSPWIGLAYSAGGFLAGYLAGRLGREVHEVHDAVVPPTYQDKDADMPLPDRRGKTARRTWDRSIEKAVALILVALAVGSTLVSGIALNRQSEQVACQTQVNKSVATGLLHRAQVASDDRAAIARLIQGVLEAEAKSKGDEATRRAIITNLERDYLQIILQSDMIRAENPIPSKVRKCLA